MFNPELFQMRQEVTMAAMNHVEGAYVPISANAGGAGLAWGGKTFWEVCGDPQAYATALNKIYEDLWCDMVTTNGIFGTFGMEEHFGPDVQYTIAPDGVSLTHVQRPFMEKDEYPLLIEDPSKLIINKMIPRRWPQFVEDREWAKQAIQKVAMNTAYTYGMLSAAAYQDVAQDKNVFPIMNGQMTFQNPLDTIFDYFRGFKNTITDLRRQPDNVKAACDKLWEVKCEPMMAKPMESPFPYPIHYAHIPAYLSPKQFREIYWPYEKKFIEWCASQGSKLILIVEGRWEPVLDVFLDLPKDSCVLYIDDDDIFKVNELLGDHQIIVGGIKMVNCRMKTADAVMDDVKKVIDTCAPGGGFILTTDKAWVTPGDITQTLVDVYNQAHEYGKK